MSHVTDFCEVFYDEVRIPLTNVVGDINDGWRVAMSTLSFERGTAFMADQVELAAVVEDLIGEAATRPGARRSRLGASRTTRSPGRLATARAEVAALRAMTIAGISRTASAGTPGPEASMIRLFHGELHQRVYQLALDIIGVRCAGADTGRRSRGRGPARTCRASRTRSAAGPPTSRRNIVGERVLGLPRVR